MIIEKRKINAMYLVEQVSRVSSKELHKQVERAIDTIVK